MEERLSDALASYDAALAALTPQEQEILERFNQAVEELRVSKRLPFSEETFSNIEGEVLQSMPEVQPVFDKWANLFDFEFASMSKGSVQAQ